MSYMHLTLAGLFDNTTILFERLIASHIYEINVIIEIKETQGFAYLF
mgnify:FL=1